MEAILLNNDGYRYENRIEAGIILADQLKEYAHLQGVVLAIPRGGIPIGNVVAKKLGFALDIILTKKIGHPFHKEYAVGAVSLTDRILVPHPDISDLYIEEETIRIREHLKQMYQEFSGDRKPETIEGRVTILVDDGVATGNTILTTINVIKKEAPSKLIVAVPVASRQAINKLTGQVDEIVCPLIPDFFTGVGAFYRDFAQVSNQEAKSYLDNFRNIS